MFSALFQKTCLEYKKSEEYGSAGGLDLEFGRAGLEPAPTLLDIICWDNSNLGSLGAGPHALHGDLCIIASQSSGTVDM